MKRRHFLKNSSLIGGTLLVSPLAKSSIPTNSQANTETLIEKVIIAMLSMQRASWEQGVAGQSLLELGLQDRVILMAYESALRQTSDGRLSVLYTDNGVTDPAASGEMVLYASEKTGDSKLQQAADAMLEYLLLKAPRAEDGTIYHTLSAPEIWIDSMYMCPPFLAAAGRFDEAIQQILGIKKRLWNDTDQLYSHRWHEQEQRLINSNYWGVGNGWALAGICRVMSKLPDRFSNEKAELERHFKALLDSLLGHLRQDAMFHNNLNDPSSFVETNLSQMVAYSIYRGIAAGYLSTDYLSYADAMRMACHEKVDSHGFVQGVCGAPHFDHPGRATEGQAFFLLMEAAHQALEST